MELGTLRVITPDGQVREYPIEVESVVIGRSEGNGVVIDHVSVSRRHAQLFVTAEKVSIEDLGSANGTFVGSQRLSAANPVELAEGQPLRIGDVEARFYRPASAGIAVAAATVVSTPAMAAGESQATLGVALASPSVPVAPGAATTATLVVQNRGQTVDQVTISTPDLPPAWVRISRPQLTLVPGAKDEVTIVLQPPRAPESTGGETPLAVAVVSREHKREVRVLGKFTILPFDAFALALQPPRGTGKFEVVAENQGNTPATYTLAASQAGQALDLKLAADSVDLEPGEKRAVALHAGPRKRSLFSRTEAQSFQVDATPARAGAPGATITGQLAEIEAPLRFWKPIAAAIVGLAAVGAIAYAVTQVDFGGSGGSQAAASPTASAAASASVPPAGTIPPASPTALALRKDGFAEIVNSAPPNECLNVRDQPSRAAGKVVGRLCNGAKVKLVSDAVSADSLVWWNIEGKDAEGKDLKGFAAEKSPDGATPFMKPVAQ